MTAVAAKLTSETLNFGGRLLTNSSAATFAAANRFGSTSVASIDNDTSIATTIVARSRGTATASFGFANANVSVSRLRIDNPTATCRNHVRSRGITRSNIVRPIARFRDRFRITSHRYSTTNAGITNNNHNRAGAKNDSRGIISTTLRQAQGTKTGQG